MSSYLFGNDDYENIPLMRGTESYQNRHNEQSTTTPSTTHVMIQQHWKKVILGCIVIVACVLFFSSSGDNNNQSTTTTQPTAEIQGTTLTLTPDEVAKHTVIEQPNFNVNYTDAEVNEEFLRQFQEVYPTDDEHENDEDENSNEDGEEGDDNELTTHSASILDWSLDETTKKAKRPQSTDDKDKNDDETKPVKKGRGGRGGRRRGGGRRRRDGGKKGGQGKNSKFDLSVLQKALKANPENPFTIDYTSIIKAFTKQYPKISGDINSHSDYSTNRVRVHKGHADADQSDPDMFYALKFFHISDTHIDSFFNPYTTSQPGVCHSCLFNSKVFGDSAYCPLNSPFQPNILNTKAGYSFGRYRCNPPPQLLASMLANIRAHQKQPAFFLITGDIGAHGLKDDNFNVDETTKLQDLCPTKFIGMRQTLTLFRELFPQTPILFSPGNNDHLPKNTVWQPYFEAFAALLVEFDMLHPSQAETFSRIGSHYVDLEVDNVAFMAAQGKNATLPNMPKMTNIRAILPDMSLLAPNGEQSFVDESLYAHLEGLERENIEYPRRAELVSWFNQTLISAEKEGRFVIFAGHQPMSTKKGENELLLLSTTHGLLFKALLAQYSHIIVAGFFGHRNLAAIQNILSPTGDPIIPSLTIPGISPRGLNQPAFVEVAMSRVSGKVLDFEQYVFDLMEENERAQILGSSLRNYLPSEVLVADVNADSGSNIVHEVIAARVNDKYDPESYTKHKEEEEKAAALIKKDIESKPQTTLDRIANHGIDCEDDEELCKFLDKWQYVGRWVPNPEDIKSWRKMTGFNEFTQQTCFDMNSRVPTSGKLYTALQVFKRAGLIGDSPPENVWCSSLYDDETMMMKCLFPEQDETEGCFNKSWLK